MGLKVKADIVKNRLYLAIGGKAVKKDLDKLYTDVRFYVADLRSGFDVITDLSECSLGHLNGVSTFRKIMNFLISKHVGNVVRIINGNSLLFKQVLNISSRICSYKPIYVSTIQEAEENLERSIRRSSVRFQINELAVEYIANEKNGVGNIYNLSTGGCAVDSATCPVSVNEAVSVKFEFKGPDMPAGEFIINATVVRVYGNTFAVAFKDIEDVQKDQLWKCLISKSQREL